MECVEAALKSSIRKEMALKSTQQAFFDDLLADNVLNGVSCDDFFVDDLLDFSNEDGFVEDEAEEDSEEQIQNPQASASVCSEQPQSVTFSAGEDLRSVTTGELTVPVEVLEDLEWLSHFVEDSFSEFSVPFPAGASPVKPKWLNNSQRQPETPILADNSCFNISVPAKARSKRARTGGRVWSLESPSLTESSSSSTSESSSSSPFTNSSPLLIWSTPSFGSWEKPPIKKQKKKQTTEGLAAASVSAATGGGGITGAQPRRCSHCGVQKTPQWRAGPLGAKTLCNACGVRFKSGRLFPEYRPACSPTFSSELHSNHHRKVVEMRRKKDNVGQPDTGLTTPAVPSF